MSESVFHGGRAQRDGGVSGELKVGRREEITMGAGREKQSKVGEQASVCVCVSGL